MSAPAGWYPDPADAARQRWWDGAQWTAHASTVAPVSPQYGAAAPYAPAALPRVEVDTHTVWVWLAIAASILPIFSLFFLDGDGYMSAMLMADQDPSAVVSASLAWTMQSLLLSLVSWICMGIAIVFCWLDWRVLRTRGVPQPFHWAWSFFALVSGGMAVYVIGRTVVLKRRTVGGGWAPLWVWIGATLITFVISIVWVVSLIETMIGQIGYVGA